MRHHRLVRLLVLSIVLLVISNIDPSNLRQGIGSAFAGFIPGANPSDQPLAVLGPFKVFLPLILKTIPPPPPAPAMTTSRYVATNNLSTMDQAGCNQGTAGEDGTVILDFGYPYYDAATGWYGTRLLWPSAGDPFAPDFVIQELTRYFLRGWARCAPAGKHLEVAMGTNNNPWYWKGMTVENAREHGRRWATFVDILHSYITDTPSLHGRVSIAGAIDIEFDWNSKEVTRAWVDAYQPAYGDRLYNFGSCDSCPWFGDPTSKIANLWEYSDAYYVAYGAPLVWPFPLIYKIPRTGEIIGQHADQWYRVSLWGATSAPYYNPMYFRGALTQYYGCQDEGHWDECVATGIINTPAQGWTQLWQALNADPRTAAGSPSRSSDIRWNATKVR